VLNLKKHSHKSSSGNVLTSLQHHCQLQFRLGKLKGDCAANADTMLSNNYSYTSSTPPTATANTKNKAG
jgi:hypothetical protein